jgi:hypothetical protein
MIVIRGNDREAARLAAKRATALVVSIGERPSAKDPVVRIRVSVRDAALARRMTRAIIRSLRAAAPDRLPNVPILRVSSRKAFDRLRDPVVGAIAVVPVTAHNRRSLAPLVESLRASGVAGVQLAWDGRDPSRGAVEASVFAVLERARASPGRAPVILAPGEKVVESLRILARVSAP